MVSDGNPSPEQRAARPDEAESRVYLIHSSLTTGLQEELAISDLTAFGRWTRRHDISGQVLAGVTRQEPFRHLSIGLETARELHLVHVVAEAILEAPASIFSLDYGGDPNG